MTDYSNYYFKDLLEAIEEGCQKIGEERDYIKAYHTQKIYNN